MRVAVLVMDIVAALALLYVIFLARRDNNVVGVLPVMVIGGGALLTGVILRFVMRSGEKREP